MPSTLKKIEEEALSLAIEARAALAGKLLMSLEEPSTSELERLWLDEAERRLNTYRSGKIQGIPADTVFRRALAELS